MEKYNAAQLKTKLTAIATANGAANLQSVFVNVVYQSLVMGNNMPDHILSIRDSNAPVAFKAALGKYLPLKFNKGKGLYEYSRVRAEKLRTELAIELTSDTRCMTVDEVAAVLPAIFEKAAPAKKEFDLDAYCKAVGTKLETAGVSNAELIGQIAAILAKNPGLVGAVAEVCTQGAVVKAA